ncbi:MAG: hypothetical protein PHU06_08805 [Gallionella sp.]|nr:hypothetical protein [Gallionella sp.]MDD4959145.1 hypothetical protein [Gallionella sp.]
MFKKSHVGVLIAAIFSQALPVFAASDADLQALRDQMQQLRQHYDQHMKQMKRDYELIERRLQQAEVASKQAQTSSKQAEVTSQQAVEAARKQADAAPVIDNGFTPAIELILEGTYAQMRKNPNLAATGFSMKSPLQFPGFNLGESDLGITANIDPNLKGVAAIGLEPTGTLFIENAYVESTALGDAFKMRFGRFFSGLGYLNERHAHAWDFADQPLVYESLWNNQIGEDGIQLRWRAPTAMFVELGGEIGRGRNFPATDRQNRNGAGAGTLFAHIGEDTTETSWRAGASAYQTKRVDAVSSAVPDLLGTVGGVNNSFSGDSFTTGLDFVWKYAPSGGNRYLKLQGEFFSRRENGLLTYNTAGANVRDTYSNTQSGWYAQSVYQFMPHWRAGLRYDQLNPGVATVGLLNVGNVISNYAFKPTRTTLMFDFTPSEYAMLRLQMIKDQSRQGLFDNQFLVQYVMTMEKH